MPVLRAAPPTTLDPTAVMGPQPLNPVLYRALRERIGPVIIANEGEPFVGAPQRDPLHPKRVRMLASSWGEYYRVNCPICKETRHRLWINHMYGQADDFTGYPRTWLATCYNDETCLNNVARRTQLENLIFGFRNAADRNRTIVLRTADPTPQVLQLVTPPGEILRLSELPPNHPARLYLVNRGYDPLALEQNFQIGFCLTVNDQAYYPMKNRIYIPITMRNELVGWQGRYVGDADWHTTQKYFGRKGMAKRLMLYNFDEAARWPFVVVVESAASVWKIGGPSVALLGKTLTGPQRALLVQNWLGKPIILILDKNARESMEGIVNEMRVAATNPIIPLYLPDDRDPGDYTHEANVAMIQAIARQAGFVLPTW